MGGDKLLVHARKALACDLHGKSADGKFGLEPVYCLGQCATSPAIMINDDLFARVTPARFDQILAHLGEEQP
jgi:formate dehydrogenase subunit gamma